MPLQVMITTSGTRLLPENAVRTMCEELLPVTSLLTPNIPEALLIVRESGNDFKDLESLDDFKVLAEAVAKLGPKNVLIKGGHCPLRKDHKVARSDNDKHIVANVLYSHGKFSVHEAAYQESRNTHGTGCSLACTLPIPHCAMTYLMTLL